MSALMQMIKYYKFESETSSIISNIVCIFLIIHNILFTVLYNQINKIIIIIVCVNDVYKKKMDMEGAQPMTHIHSYAIISAYDIILVCRYGKQFFKLSYYMYK